MCAGNVFDIFYATITIVILELFETPHQGWTLSYFEPLKTIKLWISPDLLQLRNVYRPMISVKFI